MSCAALLSFACFSLPAPAMFNRIDLHLDNRIERSGLVARVTFPDGAGTINTVKLSAAA